MKDFRRKLVYFFIVVLAFGTINLQPFSISFANEEGIECLEGVLNEEGYCEDVPKEEPLVCGEGTVVSEDGTMCEDVPKEEPLVCGEGTVVSEDGTMCEDAPKEEPLKCGEGTVVSEDGTMCEDVPKEEPLECGEGTVVSEDGTMCEDVPKEEPPLECGEGAMLSEDGTMCEDVPKEEPPLECGEGTVVSEDGTMCEDVPKEEPLECDEGTMLSEDGTMCEDVPKEEPLECDEGTMLSEDGTMCEDVPKEEPPLECGEGTVVSEDGTMCEDVPKEEPLECGEGTVVSEDGTMCEDVPKEESLVCGEGTVVSEDGTMCEDVPKEEPLVCGEGTAVSEDGTMCVDVPKEEPPIVCEEGVLSEDGTTCVEEPTEGQQPSPGVPEGNGSNSGGGSGSGSSDDDDDSNDDSSSDEQPNETIPGSITNPVPTTPTLQLPEGLTHTFSAENALVIDVTNNITRTDNTAPKFEIPASLLQQLLAYLRASDSGSNVIVFSAGNENEMNFILPTETLQLLTNRNQQVTLDFATKLISSRYTLGNLKPQLLARMKALELIVTPVQQINVQPFSEMDIENPIQLEQFFVRADGTRVPIDPVAFNLFSQNRLKVAGQEGQQIVNRFDSVLNRWVPLLNHGMNAANELEFTGTYPGVYAARPLEGQGLTNNLDNLSDNARDLVRLGILRGDNGSFNPQEDITGNQVITILMRTLGLEKGVVVNRNGVIRILPNTSTLGESTQFARRLGLLNGTFGRVQPNKPVTVQDLTAMLNNGLVRGLKQQGFDVLVEEGAKDTQGEGNMPPSSNDEPPLQLPTAPLQNNEPQIQAMNINSGVGPINIPSMDLETALMAVQNNRTKLLDSQLQNQISDVQARNEEIAKRNTELSSTRQLLSKRNNLTDEEKETLTGLAEKYNKSFKDFSEAEFNALTDTIKSAIDSLGNSQQMDMLRLQSLSNTRNEAFDVMTNFIKKMNDSRSSIIGNMR